MADWFASNAPAAATGGDWFAKNAPAAPPARRDSVMDAISGFLEGVTSVGPGVMGAVDHPLNAIRDAWHAQKDQFDKAAQNLKDGKYVDAAQHVMGGTVPVVGPMASGFLDAMDDQSDAHELGRRFGQIAVLKAPEALSAASEIDPGRIAAGARGAVRGGVSAATEPVNVRGVNLPGGKVIAGTVAGGYAARALGLPSEVGAVVGGATPIVRGAMGGARAEIAARATLADRQAMLARANALRDAQPIPAEPEPAWEPGPTGTPAPEAAPVKGRAPQLDYEEWLAQRRAAEHAEWLAGQPPQPIYRAATDPVAAAPEPPSGSPAPEAAPPDLRALGQQYETWLAERNARDRAEYAAWQAAQPKAPQSTPGPPAAAPAAAPNGVPYAGFDPYAPKAGAPVPVAPALNVDYTQVHEDLAQALAGKAYAKLKPAEKQTVDALTAKVAPRAAPAPAPAPEPVAAAVPATEQPTDLERQLEASLEQQRHPKADLNRQNAADRIAANLTKQNLAAPAVEDDAAWAALARNLGTERDGYVPAQATREMITERVARANGVKRVGDLGKLKP